MTLSPQVFAFPKDDGSDGSDRRGKILQELQSLQRKYRLQVTSSLRESSLPTYAQLSQADGPSSTDLLELALLLFWRHVAFYLDPERVDSSRPDVGLGLADTLKARNNNQLNISAFDVPTLRENLSYEFRRLSEKLSNLDLVSWLFLFFCVHHL
jgi:nuclear pore complex protein Nup205